MAYAFLNPDGSIKGVFHKPSIFMRLRDGERMVFFNPPAIDEEIETVSPVMPITGPDTEFIITPKPSDVVGEVWKRRKTAVVQKHLDAAAQALGYDSILSAVSYVESSTFGIEAVAFMKWRDDCWLVCYEVLAEVQSGNRSIPSDSELLAELPAFSIPASQPQAQ